MRWVSLLLLGALALLQWSLWFGERSLPQVHELRAELLAQQAANAAAQQRNAALRDEADDLRHGMQAVQDRARRDMGMMRPDEIYVQVLPASAPLPPQAPAASRPAGAH